MKLRNYRTDQNWVCTKIQPMAIQQIYNKVWPKCEILELDNDQRNTLKQVLDIGGADKLLKYPDGTVSFLGQRFRTFSCANHDDFTLRYSRPSQRKTECRKVIESLQQNKMVASFYAYGHVNEVESGFLRFRILKFRDFLEYWRDGKLPKVTPIPNEDGSTFLAWPFNEIPSELILFEMPSKPETINLEVFM